MHGHVRDIAWATTAFFLHKGVGDSSTYKKDRDTDRPQSSITPLAVPVRVIDPLESTSKIDPEDDCT